MSGREFLALPDESVKKWVEGITSIADLRDLGLDEIRNLLDLSDGRKIRKKSRQPDFMLYYLLPDPGQHSRYRAEIRNGRGEKLLITFVSYDLVGDFEVRIKVEKIER